MASHVAVSTTFYKKELRELQESLKETSVVVQMDNSRGLNMEQTVSEVKAQYEEIAARSRQEAENWHKTKVNKNINRVNIILSYLSVTIGISL